MKAKFFVLVTINIIGLVSIVSGLMCIDPVLDFPRKMIDHSPISRYAYPLPEKKLAVNITFVLLGATLLALSFRQGQGSQQINDCQQEIADIASPWPGSPVKKTFAVVFTLLYVVGIWLLVSQSYSHYFTLLIFMGICGGAMCLPGSSSTLFDGCDWAFCFVITATSFYILTQDLTSWYFSCIGDEFAFYDLARHLLNSPDIVPFEYKGVYGKFPVADSYYTAIFLWLFGPNVWSWKFSLVVIHIITALALYGLGRVLFNRSTAIISSSLLSVSHYFSAFDRIGYNNTHMCFTSTFTLLVLGRALTTQSPRLFFLCGINSGVLTYSIWGGLLTLPVIAMFLILFCLRRGSLGAFLKMTLVLFLGFVVTTLPGMLVNSLDDIRQIVGALNHGATVGVNQKFDTWSALLTSGTAFFFNRWWSDHYVSGPLVDPITGFFTIIGFAAFVGRCRSWQNAAVLAWVLLSLIGVVVLSPSNYPYITRLIYLLPPLHLVAGYGFSSIFPDQVFKSIKRPIGVAVILLSFLLNVQQLYVGTPSVTPIYEPRQIIKELQNANSNTVVYIAQGDLDNRNYRFLLQLYERADLRTVVTNEVSVRAAHGDGSLEELFPAHAKIIAPLPLAGLLEDLKQVDHMSGRIWRVYAHPYGDDILAANDIPNEYYLFSRGSIPNALMLF